MTASTNATVDDSASAYDKSLAAGQEVISNDWSRLSKATHQILCASGRWSEWGQVQKDSGEHARNADHIMHREYGIGVLMQCVSVQLPLRTDPNGRLSSEVLSDEILR